jgi:hypothetical protein
VPGRHAARRRRPAPGAGRRIRAAALGCLLAGVAAVTAGAGLARMSTAESGGANSFAAETLSVTTGSPASVTCTTTGLLPGVSSAGAPIGTQTASTCTFNVEYTGGISARLGVDIAVTGGPTSLFSSGSSTGLQLYLTDASSTSYVTSNASNTGGTGDTTYTGEGGAPVALPAAGISDLLVSRTAAMNGTTVNFSLDYALPQDSANTFQGGSVTIVLTFHAVQSANNTLPADCLAGQQCNAGGDGSTFAWS